VVPATSSGRRRRCPRSVVQVSPDASKRRGQLVYRTSSPDVQMAEESISGRNFHLHHSSRRRMGQGTAQTTNLHCLPSPLSCHRSWILRGTKLVGDMKRILHWMPSFNTARTGNLLRKFIEQMRALKSMPVSMVQHLLCPDEIRQVSHEDIGDGG
jgi:hypothetical protein